MNYIIGLSILFLCTISSLFGQTVSQTIALGDKLMSAQNYDEAIRAYERALFFANPVQYARLYRQLAGAALAHKDYDKARKYLDLSYYTESSDSVRYELVFSKAGCFLLENDFVPALAELYSLPDSLPPFFAGRYHFYMGTVALGLDSFELAHRHFAAIMPNSAALAQLNQLFGHKKHWHRPNPEVAFYMSVVIPGSGQIYAGDWKNGINSALLTGSLFAVGLRMALRYSVLDAVLAVFPWIQRYHQGGYEAAKEIATHKLAAKRHENYLYIIELLQVE